MEGCCVGFRVGWACIMVWNGGRRIGGTSLVNGGESWGEKVC
ncbi:hypothetical protein [Bartonella sp. AU15XJBT]|nr:hypothetical protein [Bartonella sp. AU15XJBT]